MKSPFHVVLLPCFLLACRAAPTAELEQPPLLLFCLHGLGAETLLALPNVARIGETFVRVPRVIPAFLTESVPNQVSISTGLFPEEHGIVADQVFDPVWNELFLPAKHDDKKLWSGLKPLWVKLALAGHSSVVYDFAGGNVDFNGVPEGTVKYESLSEESTSLVDRAHRIVQSVLGGARLVAVFVKEPGSAVQTHGSRAEQTAAVLRDVDNMIKSVMRSLDNHEVNVIITSDHGMANVPAGKIIYLEDYVDPADFEFYGDLPRPSIGIWPAEGREAAIFLNLTERHPHLKVHLKEDIPKHLHYTHHRRIAPLLVQADEGWLILRNRHSHLPRMFASGGYDNLLPSMHTAMVVAGPSLARNRTIPSLNMTDIFHLASHLVSEKELQSNDSKAVGRLFAAPACSFSPSQSAPCSGDGLDFESRESNDQSKIGAWPAFFLTIVIGLSIIGMAYLARRYWRSLPGNRGYKRVERSLEPDLTLRSEPLLGGTEYREKDDIQLAVISGAKNGSRNHGEDDDDDLPPGTFTI